MIDAIKEIHDVGHIHRDIKPENFRVHGNKLYITDFGTILKYKDETGKIIAVDRSLGNFIGTLDYASINALNF